MPKNLKNIIKNGANQNPNMIQKKRFLINEDNNNNDIFIVGFIGGLFFMCVLYLYMYVLKVDV